MIHRLTWSHTWPERGADFIACDGDRLAGRIYRHHNGASWLWAAYLWDGTGQSGIAASKQAAADAVREITETMLREGKDRRSPGHP